LAPIAERWAQGDSAKVMATHGSSEAIFLLLGYITLALSPLVEFLAARVLASADLGRLLESAAATS
jgi:hypothetical protein